MDRLSCKKKPNPPINQQNARKGNLKKQGSKEEDQTSECWKRQCGCLKTSAKVKELLKRFPAPPPPSQQPPKNPEKLCLYECINKGKDSSKCDGEPAKKSYQEICWQVVSEVGVILQLFVSTTALTLYYVIYCYMQMVYYMLRSAMFFSEADGPMKITIAVVTVTSLVVAFNILLRMERMIGITVE